MSKEEVRKARNGYLMVIVLMSALLCAMLAVILFSDHLLSTVDQKQTEILDNQDDQYMNMPSSESMVALANAMNNLSLSLDRLREEISEKENEVFYEVTPEQMYWGYVKDITAKYYPDIDADYVYAIIYHESRFKPDAVNEKTGVVGLMQISPKWHTERASNLGVKDLKDPYGNILVGCDLLNELTKDYDFNYALNFFAGGYAYADRYKDTTSPFISELNDIIASEEFKMAKGDER